MRILLVWAGRVAAPGMVAVGLLAALLLLNVSAGPDEQPPMGISLTEWSAPETIYRALPKTADAPARAPAGVMPGAAGFTFDKRVMLRSDYDQTNSCSTSTDSLSIYHGTLVTYCYVFTNIGSTTFVTHTLTDDKLGSTGTVVFNVPPNGQIGLAGLPPDGLTQDVTNTAIWTAIDAAGTTISHSDRVTVKVVVPLSGVVFIDQNGDGIRQGNETTGIGDATVTLDSRPPTSANRRQTRTSSSGYYAFLDVVEGPSTVSVQLPPGYQATGSTSVPVDLVFGIGKTVNFGARAATPTPTPRPTATATIAATPTTTEVPVLTPSATLTPTATTTPESYLTTTVTPTDTVTPTATLFSTATATATEVPSPTPTGTPRATPENTSTPTVPQHLAMYLPLLLNLPGDLRPPLAPSLMPIISPGDQTSYRLFWTPIYGAVTYEVERSANVGFDVPVERVQAGDSTSLSFRSSGIGTFYYRVRGRNFAGPGQWSEVQSAQLSWETEPNNNLTQANWGLISRSVVYALLNDDNDYFQITALEPGPVIAEIDGLEGENLRVALYYENIGDLLSVDTTPPFKVSTYGQGGDYYLRVSASAGYSATNPYRVVVIYR